MGGENSGISSYFSRFYIFNFSFFTSSSSTSKQNKQQMEDEERHGSKKILSLSIISKVKKLNIRHFLSSLATKWRVKKKTWDHFKNCIFLNSTWCWAGEETIKCFSPELIQYHKASNAEDVVGDEEAANLINKTAHTTPSPWLLQSAAPKCGGKEEKIALSKNWSQWRYNLWCSSVCCGAEEEGWGRQRYKFFSFSF